MKPDQDNPIMPYYMLAAVFLGVGIFVTSGLLSFMTSNGPLSAWGDGAGHDVGPSAVGLVLPYSLYFLCGVVAALSVQHKVRVGAAILAHSAPLISFAFASPKDVAAFVVIELLTFVLFGLAWLRMLEKEADV